MAGRTKVENNQLARGEKRVSSTEQVCLLFISDCFMRNLIRSFYNFTPTSVLEARLVWTKTWVLKYSNMLITVFTRTITISLTAYRQNIPVHGVLQTQAVVSSTCGICGCNTVFLYIGFLSRMTQRYQDACVYETCNLTESGADFLSGPLKSPPISEAGGLHFFRTIRWNVSCCSIVDHYNQ